MTAHPRIERFRLQFGTAVPLLSAHIIRRTGRDLRILDSAHTKFFFVSNSEVNAFVDVRDEGFTLGVNTALLEFIESMSLLLMSRVSFDEEPGLGPASAVEAASFAHSVELASSLFAQFWHEGDKQPPKLILEGTSQAQQELIVAAIVDFVLAHELAHVVWRHCEQLAAFRESCLRWAHGLLSRSRRGSPSAMAESWASELGADALGLQFSKDVWESKVIDMGGQKASIGGFAEMGAEVFFVACDLLLRYRAETTRAQIVASSHPPPLLRLAAMRVFYPEFSREMSTALGACGKLVLDGVLERRTHKSGKLSESDIVAFDCEIGSGMDGNDRAALEDVRTILRETQGDWGTSVVEYINRRRDIETPSDTRGWWTRISGLFKRHSSDERPIGERPLRH